MYYQPTCSIGNERALRPELPPKKVLGNRESARSLKFIEVEDPYKVTDFMIFSRGFYGWFGGDVLVILCDLLGMESDLTNNTDDGYIQKWWMPKSNMSMESWW